MVRYVLFKRPSSSTLQRPRLVSNSNTSHFTVFSLWLLPLTPGVFPFSFLCFLFLCVFLLLFFLSSFLPHSLPSSCCVSIRLRQQHVWPSGQRAVPLHASATTPAAAAAGAPTQQRPPFQFFLRLRLGPQHVPEQLPLLAHLSGPAPQLLPGL